MTCEFPIQALNAQHNRENFDCGYDALNSYIKYYAKQDMKKYLTSVYVAADFDNNITGYYTLSASARPRAELPHSFGKHVAYIYSSYAHWQIGR